MLKTRVVYHNGYYAPQYKGWFFWNFFYDKSSTVSVSIIRQYSRPLEARAFLRELEIECVEAVV